MRAASARNAALRVVVTDQIGRQLDKRLSAVPAGSYRFLPGTYSRTILSARTDSPALAGFAEGFECKPTEQQW